MPIEVKHGMDPAVLAALASAAGAAGALKVPQMPSLNVGGYGSGGGGGGRSGGARRSWGLGTAPRSSASIDDLSALKDAQDRKIDAQAASQKEANEQAMGRTAVKHGLDQELQEKEFQKRLELDRERARIHAEQFDFEFTTQQKYEMAKDQQAHQAFMQDPGNTPEQKQAFHTAWQAKQAGVQPTAVPRRSPFPDGQGNGSIWEQGGALVGRDMQGNPKVLVRADQQPDAILKREQMKVQSKERGSYFDALTKAQENAQKTADELGLEDSEAGIWRWSKPSSARTDYTQQQVQQFQDRWRAVYGEVPGEQQQQQQPEMQQQPAMRQPAQPQVSAEQRQQAMKAMEGPAPDRELPWMQPSVASKNWAQAYKAQDISVPGGAEELPAPIGIALVEVEEMTRKYGKSLLSKPVDDKVKQQYLHHLQVLYEARERGLIQ